MIFNNKTGGLLNIQGFYDHLIMLGKTKDGKVVTLWVNYIVKYNEQNDFKNNTSIIYCTLAVTYIFIGQHLAAKY